MYMQDASKFRSGVKKAKQPCCHKCDSIACVTKGQVITLGPHHFNPGNISCGANVQVRKCQLFIVQQKAVEYQFLSYSIKYSWCNACAVHKACLSACSVNTIGYTVCTIGFQIDLSIKQTFHIYYKRTQVEK